MPKVALEYHYLVEGREPYSFPTEELRAFFDAVGVRLEISRGEPIGYDPERQGYGERLLHWKQRRDRTGHLVVGDTYRGPEVGILGRLVDIKWRGIATVYVGSTRPSLSEDGFLFQTLVHEVGHLLNLGHRHDLCADENFKYASAMQASSVRPIEVRQHWAIVRDEMVRLKRQGINPFMEMPLKEPRALPLAFNARIRLNSEPVETVLPWGSKFEFPNDIC